jgi:hypothetical protein
VSVVINQFALTVFDLPSCTNRIDMQSAAAVSPGVWWPRCPGERTRDCRYFCPELPRGAAGDASSASRDAASM